MKCAWQMFINLLPVWMRDQVDRHGKETLQELRLRLNSPPELIRSNGTIALERKIESRDLQYCINAASAYSPWTASSISNGYITAPGGHRIGICGETIVSNNRVTGIRNTTSICIRIARDFPGIAERAKALSGSVLIIGKPGCGKTTLLRDLIRIHAGNGQVISVIDERQELFPLSSNGNIYTNGSKIDIFSGCPKRAGIEMALRCMSPEIIAVDEITAQEDCHALLYAGWCGVRLFATAHAGSREELFERTVYQPIVRSNLFDTLITICKDKHWNTERMKK